MKLMKKISALLLSICLCMSCFTMLAYASDGRISFTDPETAVGEMVDVKCVVKSSGAAMGDVEINLTYDSDALRFDKGDSVKKDGNGSLTYTASANSSDISFIMTFQALKEGTASVKISGTTITAGNGSSLTFDEGSSAVKIGPGDPSKIKAEKEDSDSSSSDKKSSKLTFEINGVTYTFSSDFPDMEIPAGYSRTKVEIDGSKRKMVENESGSIKLGYLYDPEKVGDFFLYNEENATFAPYEEIVISDTTSIIVLSDASEVNLPEQYKEATLTLNGKEFPVWQDTAHDGYYVIYAMNNSGEPGYYQYDSAENTYQKIEIEEPDEEVEVPKSDLPGILGPIKDFLDENFLYMSVLIAAVAFILFIIFIVISVKLHNRNAEIDELYDEYGIDLEDAEPAPVKKEKKPKKEKKEKKEKKPKKAKKAPIVEEEDDFDDFEDFEDFEDEDFAEEDFEEDAFADESFEDFPDEKFETVDFSDFEDTGDFDDLDLDDEFDFDDEDDDDYEIDDLDELLEEEEEIPVAKPVAKASFVKDDTFKVDFIDLD